MEVTYKCHLLGLSLLLPLPLCSHVTDCYITFLPRSLWIFHSLWTILPIYIKSPARSDDVRVILHWASVHRTFVFFISSSLLFVAFSMRRMSSIAAPQGCVCYREPFVAVDCIALDYWGKHKRKMAIRGIT